MSGQDRPDLHGGHSGEGLLQQGWQVAQDVRVVLLQQLHDALHGKLVSPALN